MPTSTPMPTKNPGDVLTSTLWNSYLRDNIDKLLTRGHRVLTVAQFAALSSPEGTKGTVAPDEAYVEVDSTNGIVWHFHYESTDASSSKWRFIGGPPMRSSVLTPETVGSTGAYVDLTTVGPSITAPRLGDYEIAFGCLFAQITTSPSKVAPKLGAAATSDNDRAEGNVSASSGGTSVWRTITRTLATSDVVKLQYNGGNTANSFSLRELRLTPVRIG